MYYCSYDYGIIIVTIRSGITEIGDVRLAVAAMVSLASSSRPEWELS
jgi:hypothetical protein